MVIGEERVAAVSAKMIAERGVLANLVEYPAVPLGKARFRMQAMATHTAQQAQQAAGIVADAVHFVTSLFGNGNSHAKGSHIEPRLTDCSERSHPCQASAEPPALVIIESNMALTGTEWQPMTPKAGPRRASQAQAIT